MLKMSGKNSRIISVSSAKPVSGLFFTLLLLAGSSIETNEVKFLVYNIQSPDWSQERRQNISEIILGYLPDVVGLNESSTNRSVEAGEDLEVSGNTAYTSSAESTIYIRDAATLTYCGTNQ
mgnify:CR=1 FL=1